MNRTEPPRSEGQRVLAFRLLSYEVAYIEDQIALTIQYATTQEEAAEGKRRVLRIALPPEAAMRAAMGLLEAARSLMFEAEEKEEAPGTRH